MKSVLIAFIYILFISGACGTLEKEKEIISYGKAVEIDSLPGQCPYLTRDTKGNAVISWVRMINDSTSAFCYAKSNDGKTFDDPIVIPNSSNIQPHGENLPKIIFKPSGEIIALWGAANPNPKNKYSGLVFYVQSFNEGQTWTDPKPLISDTASYDQRYYDVALLSNGEVGIIWLDNRKTTSRTGSALYFASTKGADGFQDDKLISEPCCQCCRTDLFVDRKGGIHVLYRGIIEDSIRDMVHAVSFDNGNIFSTPKRISDDNWVLNGCPHTGPAMTENENGLHFAWFTGGNNKGCYYAKSGDQGTSFTPRDSISGLGSHPQIASFANGDLVIAWDESANVNNKSHKRIGIQKRNNSGVFENTGFITGDTLTASYPVLLTLDNSSALVAYSRKSGDKNYVDYQRVSF